ncbi:hypothetical protein [Desulfospira joergensenii]|uniref:hypothetical protein n=1 Tax=Desulfospira joergensenii TaxID=53329 RepID=UPI0003B5FC12|nr:hypothetical protein [Desulfospira joergensenii]
MPDIIEHLKKGTFEEQYWIPAHNDRRESSLFRSNKKFIRDECGSPCWVCGSLEQREVHHIFEWSLWNALDATKVTNILNAIEFYDDDYTSKATEADKLRAEIRRVTAEKPIVDTPDDIRNLVVFCRKHHRLKHTGIHTMTFPIWLSMAATPIKNAILSREQMLAAMERIRHIDEELAALAENNYTPHRL